MTSGYSIFGVYREKSEVEAAVSYLYDIGFKRKQVSLFLPDHTGAQDFAYIQGTHIRQGAALGGVIGLLFGALLGFLLSTSVMLVPTIEPFAGPNIVLSLITGAVAGLLVGSLCGGLIGIGIPESPVDRYRSYVQDGGILFAVHANTLAETESAKMVLQVTGAQDINAVKERKIWTSSLRHWRRVDPAAWFNRPASALSRKTSWQQRHMSAQ